MSKDPSTLARFVDQLAARQEHIFAEIEDAGLIEIPGTRLRLEQPGDRMLVMQFLHDIKPGGMDPSLWAGFIRRSSSGWQRSFRGSTRKIGDDG